MECLVHQSIQEGSGQEMHMWLKTHPGHVTAYQIAPLMEKAC
jgi:hypothetical protein